MDKNQKRQKFTRIATTHHGHVLFFCKTVNGIFKCPEHCNLLSNAFHVHKQTALANFIRQKGSHTTTFQLSLEDNILLSQLLSYISD